MDNYTIIIPHYNGQEILSRCLTSIKQSAPKKPEIIIVDNASTDNSISHIKENFPDVTIIKSNQNLGYAGGCNLGAEKAKNNYIVFLNNDTIVKQGWDEILISDLQDETISSAQPKIKNLSNKDHFDYAGASGGFLDIFCYPFCRGRIFNTTEEDSGQYNSKENTFWASGAAFATKRDIFIKSGMFDTKLFAHMEEIDYHWRCQMMGYKITVCPQSVVYHEGGMTLSYKSYKKTYYNHRNSMIIFLANHKIQTTLLLLIPRVIFQLASIILDLFLIKPAHAIAQISSLLWIFFNIPYLINKRVFNQSIKVSSYKLIGMYYRSIVIDYFLLNKKKFTQLKKLVHQS